MKNMLLCALVALVLGCRTNPDTGERELDPAFVATELQLLADDADDIASMFEDEARRARWLEVSGYARTLAGVLNGEPSEATLLDIVGRAIDAVVAIEGEDLDDDERLAVFAIKSLLRRIEAYSAP